MSVSDIAKASILMVNLTRIAESEGGAQHQLALAKSFLKLGHEVCMLTPRRLTKREKTSTDSGDWLRFTFSLSRFGMPGSLDALPQIFPLVRQRLIGRFNILYIRVNTLTPFLALIGRAMGMFVIVEHNGWMASERLGQRAGSRWLASLERWSQVQSSRIAHRSRTVTEGLKRLLVQEGISPGKIIVIGNGADTKAFHPIAREEAIANLDLDPSITRLGFIGGLVPWQGVATAIEAFSLMKPNEKLRLVIAGTGPEKVRLEELAVRLKVMDRTDFIGYVQREQANLVINSFDIALAPFTQARNAEIGLSPIKIRDYAAAGRFVISARIPGISELAGKGWLATHNPDDARDLARVITQHLHTNFDRTSAQKKARIYAETHFDWLLIAKEITQLF